MAVTDTAYSKVDLDGRSAAESLKNLEIKAKQLRDQLKKLSETNDLQGWKKTEKELKSVNSEMKSLRKSTQDVDFVLKNLSGATFNQLDSATKKVRKELRNMDRQSEEYAKTLQKLNRIEKARNAAFDEMNQSFKKSSKGIGGLAEKFNKFGLMIGAAVAAVTGLSMTFRKLSEDVAKMDDVYADVMKTTGLTHKQVEALNEEFKKFDTRTSREELNLLARDAGKLGISSQEDVLKFVRAANQINVALGEDLGSDAIKDIGKISEVFKQSGEDIAKLDMEGRLLSIGSSINDLGQSSTASEAYLVDFTKRLGGVAAQAGISVQDILGYASALDQSGQAVEMSATAMSKFIMNLMDDPAKFARLAGIEVKEFTDLLANDTNAAILTVLKSLNEKGGFQQLIPVFQEMGLDGARAVGVFSSLATNVNLVTEAQIISNKSFAEANSLTNEYSVKNENLQAKLEKTRKEFKESALTLGSKLSPALLKSTNLASNFIKLLVNFPDFIRKNAVILSTLVTAFLAYTISINAATIKTTAKDLATKKLIGSLKKLWTTIIRNPWAALATVVAAATVAIIKYATETTAAQAAMKDFAKESGVLQSQAKRLFDRLGQLKKGTEEYNLVQKEILETYPELLKNQVDENGNIINLKTAYDQVCTSIKNKVALQLQSKSMDDIVTNSIEEQQDKLNDFAKNFKDFSAAEKAAINQVIHSMAEEGKSSAEIFDKVNKDFSLNLAKYRKRYDKEGFEYLVNSSAFQDIVSYVSLVTESNKEIEEIKANFAPFITQTGEASSNVEKINNKIKDLRKQLAAAETKDEKAAIRNDIKLLEEELKSMTTTSHAAAKETEITTETEAEAYKKMLEAKLTALEMQQKKEQQILAKKYSESGMSSADKEEYEKGIKNLELKYAQEKIKIYQNGTKEKINAELEYVQKYIQIKEEEQKKEEEVKSKREKYFQDLYEIIGEYLDTCDDAIKKEIEASNEKYQKLKADLIANKESLKLTEEEYTRLMLEIEAQRVAAETEIVAKGEEEKLKKKQEAREKYDLLSDEEKKEIELQELKALYDEDLLTFEEYQKARQAIIDKYSDKEREKRKSNEQLILDFAKQTLANLSTIVEASGNFQLAKLEEQKQKELNAAGENADKRAEIEDNYARKEFETKKKIARANLAMQLTELWGSAALGAIQATTAYSSIPIVGTALGIIAAAGILGAAAMQSANLIQQQRALEATQYQSTLSSSSTPSTSTPTVSAPTVISGYEEGGYTGPGRSNEPAGIVHKDEYVIPSHILYTPPVIDYVRSIEAMRKNRTSSPSYKKGYQDGGFTGFPTQYSDFFNSLSGMISHTNQLLVENAATMKNLQKEGVKGVWQWDQYKDGISKMDKIKERVKRQ